MLEVNTPSNTRETSSNELLLEKGYAVHGIKRRVSSFNTSRNTISFKIPTNKILTSFCITAISPIPPI